MDRMELCRRADEMRANPPGFFQVEGLHDLDDRTSVQEFWIPRPNGEPIHIYRIVPSAVQGRLPYAVNFHGGGMVRNHGDRDLLFCRRLACAVECVVFSVDYHLAPQYPYPYALDESEYLIRFLCENAEANGLQQGRFALIGQSSGGNLAFTLSLRLRKAKERPLAQAVCYTVFDQATAPEHKADSCPPARQELYRFYTACYAENVDTRNPEISPLFAAAADLAEMPFTIMIEGGLDELRTENLDMFRRLCDSGCRTSMRFYPESMHGFLINQMADWQDAQQYLFAELKRLFA